MLLMKILSLTMQTKKNLQRILEKNRKDPPETIAERTSNAIIPLVDQKSKSKSNDGYSNCGENTMSLLSFSADEVNDKEP